MGDVFGWLVNGVSDKLIELVLPALAAAVAGYAIVALRKVAQRFGLALSEEQEAKIRRVIHEAILRVEELKRQGAQANQAPLSPSAALAVAARDVKAILPALDQAEIEARIHAELPKIRARVFSPQATINPGLPGGGRR